MKDSKWWNHGVSSRWNIPEKIYSLTDVTRGGWDTYRFMIIISWVTDYLFNHYKMSFLVYRNNLWHTVYFVLYLYCLFFYLSFCYFFHNIYFLPLSLSTYLCLWIMKLVEKIYMNHDFVHSANLCVLVGVLNHVYLI